MKKVKLPFAVKDGNYVTIDEVERKDSSCTCPGCSAQLVVRKGELKVDHFAHKNKDCGGGLETALHSVCKEIIYNSKEFTTPAFEDIIPEMTFPVDDVILEKRLGDIIPDIIIISGGKELLVEIVVTHEVTPEKQQKIRWKNLAAIEIEARYLVESQFEKKDYWLKDDEFRNTLIYGTRNKYWLNNPKANSITQKRKLNSISRVVQNFKPYDGTWFNYVENCPLNVRQWKSGIRVGQPYAIVQEDCQKCRNCCGIEYGGFRNENRSQFSFDIPYMVYCGKEFRISYDE